MTQNKIIFIVGPTAVGKTDVACYLARKLNAEIVSCDAMQVYKEVSILTGKPSLRMLSETKHHLIDVVSISRNFDVVTFRKKALMAISSIHKKKKTAIVVGGSGLYMSVLLDGIFEEEHQERNLEIRRKIQADIKREGKEEVFKYLKRIDPLSASKIHINDTRRTIRAIEVYEVYGKPISMLQPNRQGLWNQCDIDIFALDRKRDELYEIINKRVDKMFRAGAAKEIRNIQNKRISRTAKGIIGLKEVRSYIDGDVSLIETKQCIQKNTRNFAKRQLTWFRRDKRINWISVDENSTVKNIGKIILNKAA